LERDVPLQAEVVAVDAGLGLERGLLVAPRILGAAEGLDDQHDLLGDAVGGQGADHLRGDRGAAVDASGHDSQLRGVLDGEEIGRGGARRRWGEGRWAARCSSLVSMMAASISTLIDDLVTSSSSSWSAPENVPNTPRTFAITRWRTAKPIVECEVSIFQVRVA